VEDEVIRIAVVDGILITEVIGTINPQFGDRILSGAIETGVRNGCTAYLYDFRAAKIDESLGKVYARPNQAELLGARRTDRVAMLCAEIDPKMKFLEDVASNRGFNFRLFTDEGEAKAWLKS
jgi:hypothetical protein